MGVVVVVVVVFLVVALVFDFESLGLVSWVVGLRSWSWGFGRVFLSLCLFLLPLASGTPRGHGEHVEIVI